MKDRLDSRQRTGARKDRDDSEAEVGSVHDKEQKSEDRPLQHAIQMALSKRAHLLDHLKLTHGRQLLGGM